MAQGRPYSSLQLSDGRLKRRWSQTLLRGGQSQAIGASWNMRIPGDIRNYFFFFGVRVVKHWKRGLLWNLHSWRYSTLNWARP